MLSHCLIQCWPVISCFCNYQEIVSKTHGFSLKNVPLKWGLKNCGNAVLPPCVNALWVSWIIRPHRSKSTLAQVMACCLSHYLNQCWPIIKIGLWHPPKSDFTRSGHELNQLNVSSFSFISDLILCAGCRCASPPPGNRDYQSGNSYQWKLMPEYCVWLCVV